MSRLIDADKLIEELKNLAKGQISSCPNIAEFFVSIRVDRIIDILNSQPTVFDVDKVCRKLNEYKDMDNLVDVDCAIEIVKAGGLDE